jgi:hypothetical protein
MPLDWRSAYLRQAKSDFDLLQLILAMDDVPKCQSLHYLQMATEKLAKGMMTSPGGPRYPSTHDAFVRFLRVAKGRPEIRNACKFEDANRFTAYVDGLLPLAQSIEDLSPEGDDHPNPEYPWEAAGTVYSPLDHQFANLGFATPQVIKLLKLIEICFSLS